ncbi:MAG TPA: sulfurtransferase TusA family protein [Thiotrichales bacterium]|nr:sulfurtransferase TusA family protein [Thiotrichales bacterium]
MPEFNQELDTSGLNCPMPVMKTKKALKGMNAGEVLHVIATDPASNEDIPALIEELDAEIIESGQEGGAYHFYIRKT